MATQAGGNAMAPNHSNAAYLSGQAAVAAALKQQHQQQQMMEQQKQYLLGQRQQQMMVEQVRTNDVLLFLSHVIHIPVFDI